MNKPNPFLASNLLEQKNKAHARLKAAVFFSLSIGVVCLMSMLIQGCRKPQENVDVNADTNNAIMPTIDTNPPPIMDTNPPPYVPPVVDTNPPPVPVPPVVSGQEYTIVKGDTFASVAKKFSVSVKAIQDANPNVDPKKLKIGQKIQVPASTGSAAVAPTPMATPSVSGEQTYKVKSGDTLTKIAKAHDTTVKAIQSANNLTTTSIKVGQTLKIPMKASAPAPVEMTPAPSAPAPAPVAPMMTNQ
jgi:LysM repeat protein